ncbi:MAG: aromatic ring-hydroxylating dioxygenase subunit alpha [Ancylobacter novellus]|uniref:Aromatic ring-hydroxylating dioxygenase subunit alpha n=1 Tax=Ancylobacter novellus TaxID=921 RepID=A0A2W5JZX6_ANCNO|nr:MAG: aromatic ring-hydroxylating dioxygenase subunit alpha [Ancylobacter novellus]
MSERYSREALREAYQHCWFVVARSQDIAQPKAAVLLGRDLVVFRDKDGKACVTDRYCIHRGGDLSQGEICDTGVRCPYHGWTFDGESGQCTGIPALRDVSKFPAKAPKINAYPVIERFEHVWTCLKEPMFDLPDPEEIKELQLDWRAAAPIPVEIGFMAATENFNDMAHFAFVHGGSMGNVSPIVDSMQISREGREVATTIWYPSVPGSNFSSMGDSWMHYKNFAPGIATILYDYGEGGHRYLVDFPSPVDYERAIIYWGSATSADFKYGSADEILALETEVFNEDTPVVSRIVPKEVPLDGTRREFSCPADVLTLNYRRAVMDVVDQIQARFGYRQMQAAE